jgi:hypothetical protein
MTITLNSLAGTGLFAGPTTSEPAPEAAPAPRKVGPAPRPNQYPGKCAKCGGRVEAGAGLLGDKVDGKWTTLHTTCPEATPAEPVAPRGVDDYTEPVWPGTYTVVTGDRHYTFRVDAQAQEADFAPGSVVVSYLAGQDNESDYRGFAFLKGGRLVAWKRFREGHTGLLAAAEALVADPEAALVSKRCVRCSRKLTTPESIALGIGPECASKGW